MEPHALLAASLLALAAGPLLHAALRRTPGGRRILQWAVLGAVAFLVLGHVLPECLEACGAIALVVAAVGFALPAAAERVVEARWARSSVWLGVAVLGLAAHALIDGMALGLGEAGGHGHGHGHEGHGHHEHAMGLAVVLHRLPVAAGLWGLLAKRSVAAAGGALALIAGGTVAGFALSHGHLPEGPALAAAQAFVAGVLLHVFAHELGRPPEPARG